MKFISKNKLLIFVLGFMVILFSVLIFVGEYFFNYALVRHEDKSNYSRNIASDVSDQNREIINLNKKLEKENTSNWLAMVNNEGISVLSSDGLELKARRFFHEEKTNKHAIVIHGYSNKKEDFYDIAYHYYENGFDVIAPDLRAHGESQGQYIGMGVIDKEDMKIWINSILDQDASVVIHGVSMGAATAMMLSGEVLPENVKAIVEDCGYSTVRAVFASELKLRYNLPSFPILDAAGVIARFRTGYDILNVSCLDEVAKSNIPIMVIHGDKDNFVPLYMADQIYNAINAKKDKLIFPGAGHNECRFLDPYSYYNEVFTFVDSVI